MDDDYARDDLLIEMAKGLEALCFAVARSAETAADSGALCTASGRIRSSREHFERKKARR